LVEFALILPLAALVLFGLIDFGFIFQSYSQLRNGVQAGARLASINDANYAAPSGCVPKNSSPTNTTNLVCSILADIHPPLSGVSGTFTVGIAIDTPTSPNTTGQQDVVVCAAGTLNSTTGLLGKILFGSHMGASSTILAASAPLNFTAYGATSPSITYGGLTVAGMNC
jgi:Flp pilus assembly protein TadG